MEADAVGVESWIGEDPVTNDVGDVTELLLRIRAGHQDAEVQLVSIVYAELRRLAAHYLRGERPDHTLQPTALVHEAYMRLTKLRNVEWQSRAHFFATAANVMRRLLVDHARAHNARKREAFKQAISIEDGFVFSPSRSAELIALDEALSGCSEEQDCRTQILCWSQRRGDRSAVRRICQNCKA